MMLNDLFLTFGAEASGMRVTGPSVDELGASAREAGAYGRVHPLRAAVVERQHVVLGRLGIEQQLKVAKFVGILIREVHRLAEVLCDMVQLPLIAIDHIDPLNLVWSSQGPPYGGVVQAIQPS